MSATSEPDPYSSPTYLLAILFAARRSGDFVLERLTRQRLAEIGIRVVFADALDSPTQKGANHD